MPVPFQVCGTRAVLPPGNQFIPLALLSSESVSHDRVRRIKFRCRPLRHHRFSGKSLRCGVLSLSNSHKIRIAGLFPSLSEQADPSAGLGHFLRREPLVHFLGLAALLFVANAVFSGDDRKVISVDVATQEYLVQQRQDLLLRDMTSEEKAEVVKNFIEEEILVREARKRGFENSSRIRALLIQNMRFFMVNDIPDPTEGQLRAFFDENSERFEIEPTVTYEHVYFSDPDTVPADALDVLRAGADYRSIGVSNRLTAKLARAGERQIVATFGREQAPRILGINDDQWHGPFTSVNGVHFVRVSERHPGKRPNYDAAKNWLEQQWLMARSREIVEQELAVMRENYRIEVLQPEQEAE